MLRNSYSSWNAETRENRQRLDNDSAAIATNPMEDLNEDATWGGSGWERVQVLLF